MHQYKAPDCKVRSHMRKITWKKKKKKRGSRGLQQEIQNLFSYFPSLFGSHRFFFSLPTSTATVSLLCSQTRCAACCFKHDAVRACVCARAPVLCHLYWMSLLTRPSAQSIWGPTRLQRLTLSWSCASEGISDSGARTRCSLWGLPAGRL